MMALFGVSFLNTQSNAQCGFNPNWSYSNETCLDANDGSICCAPSGGTGPFSCSITPSAGNQIGNCFLNLPPSNTPYVVIITDGNSCPDTASFTIVENQYPAIVITPSSTASCTGNGSACISIAGGSGVFNIDWYTNSTFSTYLGSGNCITQPAGTYWYRAEDTTPNVPFTVCVNSGPVTILAPLPILSSVISNNTLCQCPGGNGAIDLTLTGGVGPFSISWTGPNGFTATTEDIANLCEGVYVVNVTAGACATTAAYTVGGTIFQVSSNGNCTGTNGNDCDCNTIATNTIWDPNTFGQTSINVNATIIIPAGVTLTIDNLNLFITPHHVIRVLPGGQLITHNSKFDVTCGSSWRGIEVVGSGVASTLGQRGYLEMQNSEITHAECAIRNYRAGLNGNCNLTTQQFSLAGGTTGGRMNCYGGCRFIDNLKDLSILDFYNNGTDVNNYGGRFVDCTFLLTDAGFPSPSEWSTTNATRRIHLRRMVDMSFMNCKVIVDNEAYSNSNRVMGVFAEWSDFYWDGTPAANPANYSSMITGCRIGIWIAGSSVTGAETGHINLSQVVNNTYFENFVSVYILSTRNLFVIDNYFADMQPGFSNTLNPAIDVIGRTSTYIAYVVSTGFPAMNYTFAGNQIVSNLPNEPLNGLYVYNTGAHNNFVYGNRFTGCSTACAFNNINRGDVIQTPQGTHYECNTFINCNRDVRITSSNPAAPAGAPNQGVAPVQGNFAQGFVNNSAGNKYVLSPSNSSFIYNDIWISMNNPAGHSYRFWPTEMNGGASPTQVDPNISLINMQLNGGARNLCEWQYLFEVPQNPVSMISQGNQNLTNLFGAYQYLVDGGNTPELKSDVESSTFSQALSLYQQLLNESPALSEEVMLAAIQKEFELPKTLLVSILALNPSAAKSAAIKNALDNRNDKLDEYQMQQVLNGLQIQSVKENLEMQMSFEYSKLQKTKDNWSRDLELNGGALNEILSVYEENKWSDDRLIEADVLLRHGHCNEAANLLSTYSNHFELSSTQQTELNDYITFANTACDILYRVDPTLTQAETSYLMSVYQNSEFNLGIEAVNLLNAFGGYDLIIEIPAFEGNIQQRSLLTSNEKKTRSFVAYPNPAGEFVVLKSSNQTPAMIKIIQVDGRVIENIRPDINSKETILQLSHLQAGIYFLLLYDESGILLDQISITKN